MWDVPTNVERGHVQHLCDGGRVKQNVCALISCVFHVFLFLGDSLREGNVTCYGESN